MLWDLVMFALLLVNLVTIPLVTTFFYDDHRLGWLLFISISDAIFILDIAFNFRTGRPTYPMSTEVELQPKLVAKKYLQGWFIVDFLSCFPVDYIVCVANWIDQGQFVFIDGNQARSLKLLRVAKFFSLLKFLRVSRLLRYGSHWEQVGVHSLF